MGRVITEAQIRRIIQEEVTLKLLEEGLWDDVKAGAARLRQLVTKQFGQAAAKWGAAIVEKLQQLSDIPNDVKTAIEALKGGMQDSGESVQLDDTLKAAKELGSISKAEALAFAQQDFEGPVHDLASRAQSQKAESRYFADVYAVLVETPVEKERLNELGVTAVAGLGLAILGGLPMLFKGLHKLASVLKAERLAALFEKAEKVTHHFEQNVINTVVPDKLSFAIYKRMHKAGLKTSDKILSYEQYKGSKSSKQINALIYKALLIYFAFNGIAGVLHAGASLLGFVEGAATAVKGVELANGAKELVALARSA
jgi:hypothetical protein